VSYLVFARKHRPQIFDDLIGQEHITNILKKAITNNRIAHSYLFCGPRGVGKTSCARIFAKCLNDDNGPTITPDEDSSIIREITKGTSFDVLEIDTKLCKI
jgi:DNA polymerase-3 subunit gamma/tau